MTRLFLAASAAAVVAAGSLAGTRRIWNGALLITPSTSADQRSSFSPRSRTSWRIIGASA